MSPWDTTTTDQDRGRAGSSRTRPVFTNTVRKHSWDRFWKKNAIDPDRPQIDELLSVARVIVFSIDDLQAVKRDEIGNSDEIERLAAEHGAEVHEHELQAHSGAAVPMASCGGSTRRWGSIGPRTSCGVATTTSRRLRPRARRSHPTACERGPQRASRG
jgi:hypothetical protein